MQSPDSQTQKPQLRRRRPGLPPPKRSFGCCSARSQSSSSSFLNKQSSAPASTRWRHFWSQSCYWCVKERLLMEGRLKKKVFNFFLFFLRKQWQCKTSIGWLQDDDGWLAQDAAWINIWILYSHFTFSSYSFSSYIFFPPAPWGVAVPQCLWLRCLHYKCMDIAVCVWVRQEEKKYCNFFLSPAFSLLCKHKREWRGGILFLYIYTYTYITFIYINIIFVCVR